MEQALSLQIWNSNFQDVKSKVIQLGHEKKGRL